MPTSRRAVPGREGGLLRSTVVAAATTCLAGAVAGNALAYWSVTGSGAASGEAVAPGEITLSAVEVGGLVPGAPALSVPVRIANQGSMTFQPQNVTTVVSGGSVDCPVAVVTATAPPSLPAVAAGDAATVALGVAMSVDAPDHCQGASFALTVAVDGRWL